MKLITAIKLMTEGVKFGLKRGLRLAAEDQKAGKVRSKKEVKTIISIDWLQHLIDTGRSDLLTGRQKKVMTGFHAWQAKQREHNNGVIGQVLSHMNTTPTNKTLN